MVRGIAAGGCSDGAVSWLGGCLAAVAPHFPSEMICISSQISKGMWHWQQKPQAGLTCDGMPIVWSEVDAGSI